MKNSSITMTNVISITRCLCICLVIFCTDLIKAQAVFEINDFKAEKHNIQLVGEAALENTILRIAPAKPNVVGAAWYKDDQIDLNKGFFTEFEFVITEKDKAKGGGDGFAFVIQNQSINELGGLGDNIGYKQIKNVLALEFDLFNNSEESKNHVCLSFYDPEKGVYRKYATVHAIPEIGDGKPHYARVEYRNKQIVLYLDGYLFPVLTVGLDIQEKIQSTDGKAWIGFTSSTSSAYANHDLLGWSVGTYEEKPEDINVDQVKVRTKQEQGIKGRKLNIAVWDDNMYDQDTISIKIGDEWVLTNYEVKGEKKYINFTLRGFSSDMIFYAHNTGIIPPNTATVEVFDGVERHTFKMKADLNTAESIKFRYIPPNE